MTIVESAVLGCRVLLADEGEPIPSRFADLPTYTWDEVDVLLAAGATADDLRAVHAAKTAFGGTVVLPQPKRRPPASEAACPGCGGRLDAAGRCGWCA